jgi:hypothetical protein
MTTEAVEDMLKQLGFWKQEGDRTWYEVVKEGRNVAIYYRGMTTVHIRPDEEAQALIQAQATLQSHYESTIASNPNRVLITMAL